MPLATAFLSISDRPLEAIESGWQKGSMRMRIYRSCCSKQSDPEIRQRSRLRSPKGGPTGNVQSGFRSLHTAVRYPT